MENSKKRSAGPRRATLEKPRRAGTAIVTDPWIIDYETGQPRHPCLEDLRRNTIVAEQLEPVVSISRMDYPVTDVPGPESSLRALEMHLLHHTRHYQVMAASLDSFDQWLGLAEVLGRGGDLSRLITSAVAAGSPLVLNELSFSNQWFPLAGGARVQFVPKGPSNFGRTPPTSETARQIGCDVPAWAKNGWVDFVTVSEFLFERGDLPVGEWKRAVTTVPRETEKVSIHEVTLDVWEDVFAWGWLCLPKNLKPDERRPVVVCQHGLEGLPEDTITDDRSSPAWGSYKSFALRLAEQGFITFAPHNPYRGRDAFRTLQRKLNPLGLTLYSVINGQHQRILEWLKAQPLRSTTLPRKADSDRRHGSMRASGRSRGCRRAPTAAACRRVNVPAKKLRRLQLSAGASRPDFLEWESVPSGPGQRSSLTRAHHVATDVYRPAAWASP